MQALTIRRITVPVRNACDFPAEPPPAPRILFVSADGELRAAVERVLGAAGYDVRAVAHSGHALLVCRTAVFDVVVAELSGPDMSGPALADQLRRHVPAISAVYLGQPGTPEGVAHVLVRPFTRDDLVQRVESALAPAAPISAPAS